VTWTGPPPPGRGAWIGTASVHVRSHMASSWCAGEGYSPSGPGGNRTRITSMPSCRLPLGPRARQSRERESNPPRAAYETALEPLQSIPQQVTSGGFEPPASTMSGWRALRCSTRSVSPAGRSRTYLNPRIRRVLLRPAPAGYERPVRESNPSPPVDSRRATPASSQGTRVSGGGRTHLSTSAR
jgi:hypothetical protein